MDLSMLGGFNFNWDFVMAFLSIILIDLILAGDNAVVIALAVRSLERKQRIKGIIIGAGAAVILRVILTFFAAQLLNISFVKLFGGVLIIWIAVKLFIEGAPEDKFQKTAKTLKQAVITIVIADLVMSTDNILAVAGASKGNIFLLIFGLGFSIPLVVFTSNFLSKLMDRFPFITYIGAAVLGRVAGEMIITDPYIVKLFNNPSHLAGYLLQGFFAIGVVIAGKVWLKLKGVKGESTLAYEEEIYDPFYLAKWDIR
jgi:YjbE family integral membrane protein